MMTRGSMLSGAAATGVVIGSTQSCSSGFSQEELARNLRHPIAASNNDPPGLLRELVRYATLAPSSHNTQCWKFRLQERAITIEPDLTRRCPVVDPDDHHLFVSLGCATENLTQAALASGLQATVRDGSTGTVAVALEPTQPRPSLLFQAIS